MADVLAVQDDIVRDVSQKMRVRLSGVAEQRLRKDYKADAEAYQLYLRGRYEWNKFTGDGVQKSIEYYNQSLAKDPAYAPACVGLAHAYSVLGNTSMPPREASPLMKAYAEKALELDESLGSAHAVMGLYRTWTFYVGEWAEAERDFERALTLAPNDAQAHSLYGYYLSALGRHDEAKAEMRRALELDPLSPIINVSVSLGYYYAGQHDEAAAQARKTLELYPDFGGAHLRLGEAYEQKGMYQEAIAVLRQRLTTPDRRPGLALISSLGHAYAVSGQRAEAQKMLDELQGLSKTRYVSAYHVGLIYTGLGDKEQAFHWLGKAADEGSHQLIWLKAEPRFDPLRSDPRFNELERKVGLRSKQ
jgi:eukaryotic-like serine/threonine-protein kinase